MTGGHLQHLVASLIALEEIARQMEQTARSGKSPAGGQALTPLVPTQWEPLAAALARMQERLRHSLHQFDPRTLAEKDTARGLPATLYWLSFLLAELRDGLVRDLDPARSEARYGPLTDEERQALADLAAGLRAEVAAMERCLALLRGQQEA